MKKRVQSDAPVGTLAPVAAQHPQKREQLDAPAAPAAGALAAPLPVPAAQPKPAPRFAHSSATAPSAEALLLHADDLSSDDEAPRNRTHGAPAEWYADEEHLGYGIDGKKLMKKPAVSGMAKFLASQDDPHHRWTVYDEENDEEVVLSARDVTLLKRMVAGGVAHPEAATSHDGDFYGREDVRETHPLNSQTAEPKRRFQPSRWEQAKMRRIANAMRAGKFVQAPIKPAKPPLFLLWGEDDAAIDANGRRKAPPALPAPKPPLPGHAHYTHTLPLSLSSSPPLPPLPICPHACTRERAPLGGLSPPTLPLPPPP